MKDLSLVFEEIPKKRVAVIGDIMLDHYLEGQIVRTSPEAPIPIVSVEKEWFAPGGAGNTAVNIRGLGAQAVLIGQIGDDLAGNRVSVALSNNSDSGMNCDGVFASRSSTIEKFRGLSNGQYVFRADSDGVCSYPNEECENNLLGFFLSVMTACDAILISDYNKGLLTENLARTVVQMTSEYQKMLIVDTKPKHFRWFKGCFCIKPNKVEAEEFSRISIQSLEDAEKAGNYIKKILETNVLLTLGPMGMMLFEFEEDKLTHFSSNANDVFDVTGAGDTVLATFALALCAGASMRQAADLANHSAAIVIGKPGTSSVSLEELKKSIS